MYNRTAGRNTGSEGSTSLTQLITPRGVIANRLVPWMNKDEKVIPDFMYEHLDQWEKDYVDETSKNMWEFYESQEGIAFPKIEFPKEPEEPEKNNYILYNV